MSGRRAAGGRRQGMSGGRAAGIPVARPGPTSSARTAQPPSPPGFRSMLVARTRTYSTIPSRIHRPAITIASTTTCFSVISHASPGADRDTPWSAGGSAALGVRAARPLVPWLCSSDFAAVHCAGAGRRAPGMNGPPENAGICGGPGQGRQTCVSPGSRDANASALWIFKSRVLCTPLSDP